MDTLTWHSESTPSLKRSVVGAVQAAIDAGRLSPAEGRDVRYATPTSMLSQDVIGLDEDWPSENIGMRLGVPAWIIDMLDISYEQMPKNFELLSWPVRILDAVPVGVDLSRVRYSLLHWLLTDADFGASRFDAATLRPISDAAWLLKQASIGRSVTDEAWDRENSDHAVRIATITHTATAGGGSDVSNTAQQVADLTRLVVGNAAARDFWVAFMDQMLSKLKRAVPSSAAA